MSAFALRYARAFADVIAEEHLPYEDVKGQLQDFTAAWHAAADLREVFLDPSFPLPEKIRILDRLNEKMKLLPQVKNFIAVLLNHNRMDAYEEILDEFRKEMNSRLDVAEVQVTSARLLDEEERRALILKIRDMVQGKVEATFQEDSSLIGGVIVRVGSTVYDGSVRGRLAVLEGQLAAK
ncbi:MAG: ATP synthase F1 subunit delta [Acidobacteriaceae bacterium]